MLSYSFNKLFTLEAKLILPSMLLWNSNLDFFNVIPQILANRSQIKTLQNKDYTPQDIPALLFSTSVEL